MEHQEIKHCIGVRVLHWILAILILGIAFSGIYMEGLEKSPFKFEIYDWHKAFGVLAFFVLAILFLRTTIKPLDKLPDAFSEKEKLLINVVKKGLYLTIFLTILFGFLASSMHPKVDGIWFFGLTIPPMFGKDGDLAHTFIEIHGIMGITTLVLSFLHMAGVLKHRILKSEKEKDVLGRML